MEVGLSKVHFLFRTYVKHQFSKRLWNVVTRTREVHSMWGALLVLKKLACLFKLPVKAVNIDHRLAKTWNVFPYIKETYLNNWILCFHSRDETAMLMYNTLANDAQVLRNNRIKFPRGLFSPFLYTNMAAVTSRENREYFLFFL